MLTIFKDFMKSVYAIAVFKQNKKSLADHHKEFQGPSALKHCSIKGVKETQKVPMVYGRLPKCSYSFMVRRRASNIEIHWCRSYSAKVEQNF